MPVAEFLRDRIFHSILLTRKLFRLNRRRFVNPVMMSLSQTECFHDIQLIIHDGKSVIVSMYVDHRAIKPISHSPSNCVMLVSLVMYFAVVLSDNSPWTNWKVMSCRNDSLLLCSSSVYELNLLRYPNHLTRYSRLLVVNIFSMSNCSSSPLMTF